MLSNTGIELVKLGVDQVKRVPVTNFSQTSRNEAMRAKFFEIMGTEKFDVMAYNAHKYELFEIIKEVISQTIANGDGVMSAFYNAFVEEHYVELGDSKEFEVENDAYLTVGKISGNNWDLDRQRMDKGTSFTVKTDAYYIKVYEYFKRFMTGRSSFEELVSKVDTSIKKFKDDFVAEVFKSAVSGLPAGFKYSGSYNQAEIQKVLTNTSAANYGTEVVLVGTRAGLNKLQNITVTNLSDTQKAEYNSKGFVREWNGYTCVELPTVFKGNSITEFCFDNDTIYVLPSGVKPVKIIVEGEPIVAETNEIADLKDMTKEFATIFRLGGAVIYNRLLGCLELS